MSLSRFTRPALCAAFLLLSAAGCRGEKQPEPQASVTEVLAGIPIYPGSRAMSTAAGADAAQAGFLTSRPADSVAAWYRDWFAREGWSIGGDVRAPDGSVNLHAEKAGRPLWLLVKPIAGGLGAQFSVIGAETDSASRRN